MADLDAQALVVWLLDERRYALPLAQVQRVLLAIDVTPLPDAPQLVLGVVNVQGRIMPVVDLRQRLGLQRREARLSDHLMLVRTARRWLGFFVDAVQGVVYHAAAAWVPAEDVAPRMGCVAGVLKLADDLVLIHDLDALLPLDDELALDLALSARTGNCEASAACAE